jgi:hypothetical protein
MRSSFVATTGLKLIRSPSQRVTAARWRLAVVLSVLGLALASGALGLLTAPSGSAELAAQTGPFSYFPSE